MSLKELGQIEEIEPPDGVGESFADGEGVEAAVAEQDGRRWGRSAGRGRVGLGGGGGAAQPVVGEEEPDDAPEDAHRAGGEEGGSASHSAR